MQVTLNIEAGQLGDTVVDLFKSLTTEQKQAVAVEVVTKWFTDPEAIERANSDQKVLNELRASSDSDWNGNRFRGMADDQLRRTSPYEKKMRDFKSSKTVMIDTIRDEMIETFKAEIKKLMDDDEQVKATKEEAFRVVQEALPHIAAEAMTRAFLQQLQNNYTSLNVFSYQSQDMTNQLNLISQKLGYTEQFIPAPVVGIRPPGAF